MPSKGWHKRSRFLLCISVILITLALLLLCLWPMIFDSFLVLKPGSVIHKYWDKTPVDVLTDFHLFNWTNPEDVYNVSVKPTFVETGPYRYWQKEQKANITWNENGTVTFRVQRWWHFDDSEKNGNLTQKIVTINTIALGASYVTRNWNYFVRRGAFMTLSPFIPSISVTKTADELLFEGYTEPILQLASSMPFLSDLNLPKWKRFGWCYERNGSLDFYGRYNMGTGEKLPFGQIFNWNDQNQTAYFDDDCGKVNGSAGEYFPSNLQKNWVSVFCSDMRRSGKLTFQKEETVQNILGYKYILDDLMLDNGTIYPENRCFCNGECVPSGMLNISRTKPGIPLFVSLPHFYKADPYYLNLVNGLEPNANKHEFSMIIEPATGIPLRITVGIQLNLLVQPVPGVPIFENVQRFVFPVLWTRQLFEIHWSHAFLIKLFINTPIICTSVGSGMIMVSITLLIFVVYRKYIQRTKRMKGRAEVLQMQQCHQHLLQKCAEKDSNIVQNDSS